jgi:hypothetical protein
MSPGITAVNHCAWQGMAAYGKPFYEMVIAVNGLL